MANNQSCSNKISFLTSHRDQTHIVVDFDGTLTQYFDEERRSRPSIISLLRDEHVLDEDYTIRAKDFHAHYGAIEHNPDIDYDVKSQAMDERWTKHQELLMEKGLNKKHIEHIVAMNRIVMRAGTDHFLNSAYKFGIPVIVFSASGIGQSSIALLLEHRGLLLPNISIVSNRIYRDEAGVMTGFSKPIIHSLNKKESVIRSNQEYASVQKAIGDRPHALVIGDGLGDAGMVDERENRTLLKIGFCNDKVEERSDNYLKHFDIVVTHDEGFDEVLKKLERVK